jgi:hypothetical protein
LLVPRRPSVFVLALTVGDYLLWNWSLSANHEALALISGLTLPPLALVSLWIIAVNAMRLVAAFAARRRAVRASRAALARERTARTAPAGDQAAAARAREESTRIAA